MYTLCTMVDGIQQASQDYHSTRTIGQEATSMNKNRFTHAENLVGKFHPVLRSALIKQNQPQNY